jgi:WD40 repeat protein
MNNSQGRKKSPIVFFLAAFAAIAIIMLVVHRRSSLAQEIRFPLNNGIARLWTYGNSLAAVSHDKIIYVWDWGDLSKRFQTSPVESDQAALLESDLVISVGRISPRAVVISSLRDSRMRKEIPVPADSSEAHLCVNRDGSVVVVLLTKANYSNKTQKNYELILVDVAAEQLHPIVEITEDRSPSRLTNLTVSDDGRFVAVVGEKGGCGWIVLVDVIQKGVVWQKEMPEPVKFHNAVFSRDGKFIYTRGSDSTVYKIETPSGKVLERLLPIEENKSTLRIQPVQTVAISPDGQLLAATVFGAVYVWDNKTGKIVFSKAPAHKLISSMVFSPDSGYIATSDMRQGGTIKVWRMPAH